MVLLAGLGGGCVSPDGATPAKKSDQPAAFGQVTKAKSVPGYQGPGGEPVEMVAARGATPSAPTPNPSTAPASGGVTAQQPGTLFGSMFKPSGPVEWKAAWDLHIRADQPSAVEKLLNDFIDALDEPEAPANPDGVF